MKTTARRGQSGDFSFAQVPRADIQRSMLNRSCGRTMTFDAPYITPIYVEEVLPGDSYSLELEYFVRMTTPQVPFLDNAYIDFFFFFVPYRLIFDEYEAFFGATDKTAVVTPKCTAPAGGYAINSLQDHMEITPLVPNMQHNNFFPRGYNLIYNEWYRKQFIIPEIPVDTDAGPDDPNDYILRRRAKRPDYFTSANPFAQLGAAVSLPLGASAPLQGTGLITGAGVPSFAIGAAGANVPITTPNPNANSPLQVAAGNFPPNAQVPWGDPNLALDLSGVTADLSTATAATINVIRQAFQIQKYQERQARGGVRYQETILSFFGVYSDDARQNRPEYLGGGSLPLNVHPVAATTSNFVPAQPLGDLGAFVTGLGGARRWHKSFTEHGILLGLVNVRADLRYQHGLPRMHSRDSVYDYYWPTFAHLGEQEILQKEIFVDGTVNDDIVFGYIPRYDEYRFKQSSITGTFRSQAPASLDVWHLAQDFATAPTLNQAFIEEDPPFARVSAVQNEPLFRGDFWFNVRAARPLPVNSVPGLVDHF